MDGSQLTPEQAAKMRDKLAPHVAYLNKVANRMRERGFPFYDDLYLTTTLARDNSAKLLAILTKMSRPQPADYRRRPSCEALKFCRSDRQFSLDCSPARAHAGVNRLHAATSSCGGQPCRKSNARAVPPNSTRRPSI
jgi:hypothetical protein